MEVERGELPVGDIRRRRIGLVTVHGVRIPRVRLRASIVHPVAATDHRLALDLIRKPEAWTDTPTAVAICLAAVKYRCPQMADRVLRSGIECGKLSLLL